MKLVWSGRFTRAMKKVARRNPASVENVETALRQLEADPHHPSLRTHRLGGDLKECWACSAGYDLRGMFVVTPVQNDPS
jgi:mRNA-degrading endonuclease YafQ of YafQ-DinJ toxin-antitoxin module